MPELPEVHTIASDLKKNILGTKISKSQIFPSYNTLPSNTEFVSSTEGKEIMNVYRVAKNIILELDGGRFIVFHLAMTGRILLREEISPSDSWEKVRLHLSSFGGGSKKEMQLRFCDMRMFGKVHLMAKGEVGRLRNKYGPEPIDPKLTPEKFLERIRSKKTNIKNALLDQSIISGLGNIYATDTLWMAEIHPETPTQDIYLRETEKLLISASEILREGIKNRGSTLEDKMYVDIFGRPGRQQNHFRVYGKSICSKCHSKTSFKQINGRGTYFCPTCQKPAGSLF